LAGFLSPPGDGRVPDFDPESARLLCLQSHSPKLNDPLLAICVHIKKIHGIYCVRRAEERGCVVFLGNGPVFQPSERANRANFFVELIGSL
jgi:hypothetical protein